MLIGYARVSTREQETYLQIDALNKAGVEVIYQEKTSSVGSRPELQKLLSSLAKGDCLVVYKMDRIARSLKDLLSILERVQAIGANIRSLTEPLDTSVPVGIFMVQVLGAVAQLERSIIRERTVAGQLAAYRRGVPLGRRKHATPPETVEKMRELYATGEYTYPAIGKVFGVHASTAKRLITGRSARKKMPVLGQYLEDDSAHM
ncbi:recombinase family protein [Comamonas thiooxydans]|uniref:recombinase family protein n=1 Tax=Comamonas thiooxydans TaxID=363952 RepID=UPI001CC94370|nr:recombinase family protein [Comamonas thiooxydans]UBQ43089.1 recombinase family protein [Comamonas thiooxydans]